MSRQNAVELIINKRDGKRHEPGEIAQLVGDFMANRLTDYQMSAWLMAALLRGLDASETWALTSAMLSSGRVLKLRSVSAPTVDKHSTGGVGDKISLCLAPLVAECGAAVPMISGRGLGHTGGTLDKLEAIPGYQTQLGAARFEHVVRTVGVSIIGQSQQVAPADRRLYALRDVTGTVESIPLIVASILSKKLAEGAQTLVFDVKVGRGAFMKTKRQAEELARTLVRVTRRAQKRAVAVLTDMSHPIGNTIGNALEVREAIDVLKGGGTQDTRELTLALSARMLLAANVVRSSKLARRQLEQALDSGRAFERFLRMVSAHGGDTRAVENPQKLPRAPRRQAVRAKAAGFVGKVDPLELGWVAMALGAGRQRTFDRIDPRVGIELTVKLGDSVAIGQTLAWVHAKGPVPRNLLERVQAAFVIGKRPKLKRRVQKLIGA